MNTRSIGNKLYEIELILNQQSINILTVSKIWRKPSEEEGYISEFNAVYASKNLETAIFIKHFNYKMEDKIQTDELCYTSVNPPLKKIYWLSV